MFLDVDDLEDIGELETCIRKSSAVAVFLSAGYLESRNCLRELRAAIEHKKQIVVIRETDRSKGAVSDQEEDGVSAGTLPRRGRGERV